MFNLYDIHITIIAPTRLHKTQIKSLLYETCHLQSQKKHLERKKDGRRKQQNLHIAFPHYQTTLHRYMFRKEDLRPLVNGRFLTSAFCICKVINQIGNQMNFQTSSQIFTQINVLKSKYRAQVTKLFQNVNVSVLDKWPRQS